jgi:hypothetical protein
LFVRLTLVCVADGLARKVPVLFTFEPVAIIYFLLASQPNRQR